MFSPYGELRPTGAEIGSLVCSTTAIKFQRVSRPCFVTLATLLNGIQPNFARCLAVFWHGTLYIYILGALVLPGAKFTLCPSLVLSYIGSVTHCPALEQWASACGVVSSRDTAAIPFDIGRSNCLVMAALCNRGPLYFCPVVSFLLLSSFFSSPNLSGHRLDLYHTSTSYVALVRI